MPNPFFSASEGSVEWREIFIAKAGTPIAKLVPIATALPVRRPGFLKGKIRIADDFDALLPSKMLATFDGGG